MIRKCLSSVTPFIGYSYIPGRWISMYFTENVKIFITKCTDNDNLIGDTKWSICENWIYVWDLLWFFCFFFLQYYYYFVEQDGDEVRIYIEVVLCLNIVGNCFVCNLFAWLSSEQWAVSTEHLCILHTTAPTSEGEWMNIDIYYTECIAC